MHSKDSYSAVNSPHINTFWKHFHCQKSIPKSSRKTTKYKWNTIAKL